MRLLVLGIDALDADLLRRFQERLPNFRALAQSGRQFAVRSTFPPDSDTAWATIVSGLNPAQHGIVRFLDPLEKSLEIQTTAVDNTVLRGKTFWEILGHAGYRTLAVFPHLGYPVWDVPGVMIARGSAVAEVQAWPTSALELYPEPEILSGVRGFPARGTRGLEVFAASLRRQAFCDAEFASRLMQSKPWDLCFVYWSTIDAVGHFFWADFDPHDPGHVAGNRFEGLIPEAYSWFDEILGEFMRRVGEDTAIIVVSDHGHGGRPGKLVNINELLRRGGYLAEVPPARRPAANLVEAGKRWAARAVGRLGLAKMAGAGLRRIPGALRLYTRPPGIDWDRTVAYATDLSGIKAYSYGGVRINRELVAAERFEALRGEIIRYLSTSCAEEGRPLIKMILAREDLYEGPHIGLYPEIVIDLLDGYGLGWGINLPVIGEAASRGIVPGSHKGDSGVFLLRSPTALSGSAVDLRQVRDIVLAHFGQDKT